MKKVIAASAIAMMISIPAIADDHSKATYNLLNSKKVAGVKP